MVTGTTACSPSAAVSLSLVLHTSGLLATATCDWSGKLTSSMPHSGLCARCSGLDSESSNPPERRPDPVTRSAGGTVTVSVRPDGCGPCTRTSSRVCLPGGTGTRTLRPSADRFPWCTCPFSVTVRWLRATIWRPDAPPLGISRTVTLFEARDSTHVTPGASAATPDWATLATTATTRTSRLVTARTTSRDGSRRDGSRGAGAGDRAGGRRADAKDGPYWRRPPVSPVPRGFPRCGTPYPVPQRGQTCSS